MGKRPKNWTPTPAERQKQSQESKVFNKFDKGILTYIGESTPVEFKFTPDYKGFTKARQSGWSKEELLKLIEENPWMYEYEVDKLKEPEVKKDPVEEFTDEWYEKNKGSV